MKLNQQLAAALIAAGSVTAAPAGTLNLMFDGFCDGFSVTFTAGVAFGTETGCVSGPAVGTKGSVRSHGKAFSMSLDHLPNTIYIVRLDHTWSIYTASGAELQSGTWSNVLAGAAGSGSVATGQQR